MDKLEPILKQKFWIILGVGIILTFAGWWMATGTLAETIATRKSAIEAAEGKIPGGELPNESWSAQLGEINAKQEAMVRTVRRQMWEQQEATMFWPENVLDAENQTPVYRGGFGLVARNLYRSNYMFGVEQVWRIVRPIELDGSGLVQFPLERMPIKESILGDLAPSSEVMWDAQEDLWLTIPILQAIREVNGGENSSRSEASIHIIDRLELMGGERTTGEQSGGGGEGGMDGDMGAMGGGLMGGGGGGGRRGEGQKASADFEPAEEFGNSGRESRTGGGGGGMISAMGGDADADAGGGGSEAPKIRRYVDDDESAPFKTRAFYLSLVMDHRKVPRLLGELTAGGNSAWPIEIVRVQVARINPDDAEGRGLGAGGMMAGGGAGFPGVAMADETDFDADFGVRPNLAPSARTTPSSGAVQQVSLESVLQDPFMARVAIAGLIYMYRPVDAPPPVDEATEAAEEQALPTEMPLDDVALPADPAVPDPANLDPDASTPAAATPATPADPTDPADPDAAPAAPATPAPPAAPGATPPNAPPDPGEPPLS